MRALRSGKPVGDTSPAVRLRRRLGPEWLAWTLWVLAMLALAAAAWLDHLLRQSGRSDLTIFDAATLAVQAAHAGLATVGAVVASRRPRHPVGWLILVFGLLGQGSFVISSYADYGLLGRGRCRPPGWWPPSSRPAALRPSPAWRSSCCSRRPGHCPRLAGGRWPC
jgi:hypothetical protein